MKPFVGKRRTYIRRIRQDPSRGIDYHSGCQSVMLGEDGQTTEIRRRYRTVMRECCELDPSFYPHLGMTLKCSHHPHNPTNKKKNGVCIVGNVLKKQDCGWKGELLCG